jgi:hypothetical protein
LIKVELAVTGNFDSSGMELSKGPGRLILLVWDEKKERKQETTRQK